MGKFLDDASAEDFVCLGLASERTLAVILVSGLVPSVRRPVRPASASFLLTARKM